MITKKVEVLLTKTEIESPEPIRIVLAVTDGEDKVEYKIDYPKESD
jgi:hypothetical protein